MNEVEALGKMLFTLPVSDRAAETAPEIMRLCDEAAEAILDAGYTKRETRAEYAAGFRKTGEIYNFHHTREEAQKFVDSMNAEGVDMVVMTREVLPQDASDWTVAK
jgi:hypothetical protein